MALKKKKTTGHLTGLIFWICLILLVTPFAILGWILYSSSMDSDKPVFGNRYDGDLNPAITSEQLDQVESAAGSVSGVEKAKVEMSTATLRVYADISDSADSSQAYSVADEIYGKVTSILSPSVYFSQSDGKKMYDMEIHVYNTSENTESDSFVYVIKTKTSSMSEPVDNLVSEPIDAELAQSLRDDVEARLNPTPTPDEEEGGEINFTGEDLPEGEEGESTEEGEGE
ncbi:MAG: hypothetical protein IKR11_01195 [Solobacterium sp.]|nr:hypothetical protein [Solobacterium sp.]